MGGLAARLQKPVDAASIGAFRLILGLVLAAGSLRFVLQGWVDSQLVSPRHHFVYGFAPWVSVGPRPLMFGVFGVQIASALALAVGFHTRLAAGTFWLAFGYVELIDRAYYLNHYYLVTLLVFLLWILPSGGTLSVDARTRPMPCVPFWMLLTLRVQVAVVYVFAGIAKLNSDWLVHAQPLRIWLAARSDLPWLGSLLAEPATAHVASVLGALFDLGIVGFLLWRPTRRAAFITALSFHGLTGLLLPIGMFPWIMSAALTLFLAPDWPRVLVPRARDAPVFCAPRWLAALLAAHVMVQVLVPLACHLREHSAWRHEGFDFAWKVMLVEKSGRVSFRVRDRTSDASWTVAPSTYLNEAQERALAQSPWLIRDLARRLSADARREGRDVSVTADAFVSLNGRPSQRLIRGDLDLTRGDDDFVLPAPVASPSCTELASEL